MIRIGARRSPLAVAQAEWVAARLQELGHECELTGIDSLGDIDRRRLTEIGGTGIFATVVRDLLRSGQIDVAVHSLKDLPVAPAPQLVVAGIPEREDVRDVLVGLDLAQWRDGTRVGTGSPRRAVQLEALARRSGVRIEVVPIRGNVDRRLDLVRVGEVDATVLAAAGLVRLGRLSPEVIGQDVTATVQTQLGGLPVRVMGTDEFLPAAGQGALAVECHEDAPEHVRRALAEIDHLPTRAAVEAERGFLSRLEAGCLAPVGAHAVVTGKDLTLRAVAGEESSHGALVRAQHKGPAARAVELGQTLAGEVLGQLDATRARPEAE